MRPTALLTVSILPLAFAAPMPDTESSTTQILPASPPAAISALLGSGIVSSPSADYIAYINAVIAAAKAAAAAAQKIDGSNSKRQDSTGQEVDTLLGGLEASGLNLGGVLKERDENIKRQDLGLPGPLDDLSSLLDVLELGSILKERDENIKTQGLGLAGLDHGELDDLLGDLRPETAFGGVIKERNEKAKRQTAQV